MVTNFLYELWIKKIIFPFLKTLGQHVQLSHFLIYKVHFAQKHNLLVHRQPIIVTTIQMFHEVHGIISDILISIALQYTHNK